MEKSWGSCKNKTECQRQEVLQNVRTPENSWNTNQQELIQKPPFLHWNQAAPKSQQISEQVIHTKLILQQRRNITLSIKVQAAKSHTKPIETLKLTTGHFIALQREEIQLHPPEHRHKLP